MNFDSLENRLASIERRLSRIEREVGLQRFREEPAPDASAPLPPALESVKHQPPPVPMEPEPQLESIARPLPVAAFSEEPFGTATPADAPMPVIPIPPLPVRPGFEQTVGLKWAGWIGAVVLTIGAALGIKFAYDQGWFGLFPDEAKLALMSLAGVGLLITGEVVFRRIDKVAAAALYGAGVAIFFLVSFAGFNYYHLYERDTAFILMGISTLIGAAVALRGGMVSIAVLSLIGGNIAPIALRSDHPRLVPFLGYLLMLQVVALALCVAGRGARWWTLRGFSLATLGFWMAAILFTWSPLPRGWDAVCIFTFIYAALYHSELLLSARLFDARVAGGDQSELVSLPRARAGMIFALFVTALLEAALLWLFRHESQEMRGGITLALGTAASAVGWFLALQNRGPATFNHSIGYRIQAAALLVVAVPVALSGIWVVVAWAALAVAFAVLGAALDLSISRRAAVVTWFLGVLYLAAWTAGSIILPGARTIWLTLLNTPVPAYAVLAWLLAVAAHAIAMLLQSDWTPLKLTESTGESDASPQLAYEVPRIRRRTVATEFVHLAQGMSIAAAVAWCGAALLALPHLGATFMLILYVWLLVAAELFTPKLAVRRQAVTLWVLTAMKWVLIDGLLVRLSPGWRASEYWPLLNPLFILGALLALTAAFFYLLRLRDQKTGAAPRPIHLTSYPLGVVAGMILIFGIGFGFEIDRIVERAGTQLAWHPTQLKHLLWTPLAMMGVCALLATARQIAPDPKNRPLWARDLEWLPLLIAAKFLVIDTIVFRFQYGAALSTPILNFETIAALLVGAGVFYTLRGSTLAAVRDPNAATVNNVGPLAIVMILLWAGSLEIDRAFSRMSTGASGGLLADPARAEQVALSIFWSLFAVASVITGFRFRTAGLRYIGLGLFAITLLKVVAVDMSQVQTGYRILSFLGLGGLLLGTSVLYGKLSPRLLSMNVE